MSKINWAMVTELLQQVEDWSMDHMLPTPAGDGDVQSGNDGPSDDEVPEISSWPGDGSVSFSGAGTQAFAFAAALAGVGRERDRRQPRRSLRPQR